MSIYNREILYHDDCKARLMEGVNGLADAVAVTMGPRGKLVAIKLGYHDPRLTKDGVSVAREVFFADRFKNMGAEMLSGVALRTAMRCGDGTTTATVLARALLMHGGTVSAREIDDVVEWLHSMARPVTDRQDKYNVALVSANGDAEVAALIADTLETVGVDGQVTIELSPELGVRSEVVQGMSFARGYVSPYFVTNTQKMTAELDNPLVLVLDKHVHTLEQIYDRLNDAASAGRSMLIIAREVGGEALSTLINNKVKNGLKVCAVSAVDLTEDFLEDICVATGASLTDGTMGSAGKIVVHHDKTVIVEGAGTAEAVAARCDMLREAGKKDRLARLSGGVAVLWVGGSTEAEASERRDRVEDALSATRAAVEMGIVPGGGVALLYAGSGLAAGAVRDATEAPIRQILKNAGVEPEEILPRLAGGTDGYDVRDDRFGDMFEMGIIDPLKVVMSALRDAASVAVLVEATAVGIVELDEPVARGAVRV